MTITILLADVSRHLVIELIFQGKKNTTADGCILRFIKYVYLVHDLSDGSQAE